MGERHGRGGVVRRVRSSIAEHRAERQMHRQVQHQSGECYDQSGPVQTYLPPRNHCGQSYPSTPAPVVYSPSLSCPNTQPATAPQTAPTSTLASLDERTFAPSRQQFQDGQRESPTSTEPATAGGYHYADGVLYSEKGEAIGSMEIDNNASLKGKSELQTFGACYASNGKYIFTYDQATQKGAFWGPDGSRIPGDVRINLGPPPGTVRTFKQENHSVLVDGVPGQPDRLVHNHIGNVAIYKKASEVKVGSINEVEVTELFSGKRDKISLPTAGNESSGSYQVTRRAKAADGTEYVYLTSSDGKDKIRLSRTHGYEDSFSLQRQLHTATNRRENCNSTSGVQYANVGWVADRTVTFNSPAPRVEPPSVPIPDKPTKPITPVPDVPNAPSTKPTKPSDPMPTVPAGPAKNPSVPAEPANPTVPAGAAKNPSVPAEPANPTVPAGAAKPLDPTAGVDPRGAEPRTSLLGAIEQRSNLVGRGNSRTFLDPVLDSLLKELVVPRRPV